MRSHALVIALSTTFVLAAASARSEEKIHELSASPATVHRGFFDAALKPVLTIDSGDIVRLWTTTGNPRYFESLGVPKEKIPAELFAAFEGAPGEGRDDHTLDGPIAVRDAAGATSIMVHYPPWYGVDKALASLELFAGEVAPQFRTCQPKRMRA